jgi:hypothetical protein
MLSMLVIILTMNSFTHSQRVNSLESYNLNNIKYANLNLTFLNTYENKYFGKAGIYSQNSDLNPINGMLRLVVSNTSNTCIDFLNTDVNINVALLELNDYELNDQIELVSCFSASILITNSDSNFLLTSSNFSKKTFIHSN